MNKNTPAFKNQKNPISLKFTTLFNHDFHLVNRSQLPFIMSMSSLLLVTSIVFY
jgi:hypothetical protein